MTLFDTSDFGGDTRRSRTAATKARNAASRRGEALATVEPMAEGWTWMRNNQGVMPFAHRVQTVNDFGAAVTHCGAIGTILPERTVQMTRCPLCDEADPTLF